VLLLEANVNKEVKNAEGKTARMIAFKKGHTDCVRLLDA
jgi:ankyrin repeat protein